MSLTNFDSDFFIETYVEPKMLDILRLRDDFSFLFEDFLSLKNVPIFSRDGWIFSAKR